MARNCILVADDSAVVRTVLARGLAPLGVPLVEAASLEAGLGVDPRTLLGAVLDIDLGDGSGVTLAEALRGADPSLPIAFFTDDGTSASGAAKALGPLFKKPSELDELVAWVRGLRPPGGA